MGFGPLIVARFKDGRVIGGTTADFRADRSYFHAIEDGTSQPVRIAVEDLKALFFVKTLIGNHQHQEAKSFRHRAAESEGRHRVWVEFLDGEELAGYAETIDPETPGFFIYPTDAASNLECVFVIRKSTLEVHENEAAEKAALAYEARPHAPSSGLGITSGRWDEMLGILPTKPRRHDLRPASGKDYFLGDW
jgi:hypothetical protein